MRALRAFLAESSPACELCGVALATAHEHVLTLATRELSCCCRACALLFDHQAAPRRRVVRVAQRLAVELSDAEWASLGVPVGLAFFVRDSHDAPVVAEYPSPAGRVRSELPTGVWQALVTAHSALAQLEPAIQAILVIMVDRDGRRLYRLSIDCCYELSGAMHQAWQSGGGSTRVAIDSFIANLEVQP